MRGHHPIMDGMHAAAKVTGAAETFTLGRLIDALKSLPPDTHVCFDFCGTTPGKLISWRGVYSQLALPPGDGSGGKPVAELIADCEKAVGGTFEGYKGGDYVMDRETPVYVDRYGECSATCIIGVSAEKYGWAYIGTARRQDA